MTLIAFTTSTDRAEIATDTLSYTPNLRKMGQTSKLVPLLHLDAATTMTGSTAFGAFWKVAALGNPDQVATFDAFAEWAPSQLREMWSELGADNVPPPTVYLIGFSSERQAFTAWAYPHETDFEPVLIEGTHITPSPLIFRPHDMDLERMRECDPDGRRLAEWAQQPACPTPESVDDWVALCCSARKTRNAWAGRSNVAQHPVGGHLHLTTLQRGRIATEQVHTFDDSGEEFAAMIRGTAHPQAQLGACPCASGKRYVDCHLVPLLDKPCTCGSGRTFADCCRVSAEDTADHVA